jgi:hypothetical protein
VRHRRFDHGLDGERTGRVLHALADFNADGFADLGVFSLHGENLWKARSSYEVHFGTLTPTGVTEFSPEVGTAIESDGIPFGLELHDLEDNGQIDLMITTINPTIFNVVGMLIRGALAKSSSRDIAFYRMDDDCYPNKPNERRRGTAHNPGVSGERAALFLPVFIGDVNGDDRSDLLIGTKHQGMQIHLGVPGPALFTRHPQCVAVDVPYADESSWLEDLNKDGKQDIVMHHSSASEPHRLIILIAR